MPNLYRPKLTEFFNILFLYLVLTTGKSEDKFSLVNSQDFDLERHSFIYRMTEWQLKAKKDIQWFVEHMVFVKGIGITK